MMNKDFFEMEVREGFPVPSFIKYGWASQLKILSIIDDICKKHNIVYYAGWGTLLGAVRHKGFIPWDDDMDLCMKRVDYEHFLQVAEKELPSYMKLYNIYNEDKHGNCITTIFNCNKAENDAAYVEQFNGFPVQIGVDIFALDYIPDDEQEFSEMSEAIDFLVSLIAQYEGLPSMEKMHQLQLVKKSLGVSIEMNSDKSVTHQLGLLLEKVCASNQNNPTDKITNFMVWQHYRGYIFSSDAYEKSVTMPFENIMLPVPQGYDEILTKDYGDYMTPAPAGSAHNYPYFLADYFRTLEAMGRKEYAPSTMEMPRNFGDREAVNQTRWGEYISKAEELEKLLEKAMDTRDTNTVGEIQLGLMRLSRRLDDEMQYEESHKKDILFITCQAKHWKSMEEFYKKEIENPENNVLVLVLPYQVKNFDGTVAETRYELEQYPEELRIVDYTTIDFSKLYVNRIYTQIPWDNNDEVLDIDKQCYVEEQRKASDMLIYIPYWDINSYDEDNKRAEFTTQYICRQPGVIMADRIVVSETQVKNIYLKQLVQFTGEQTEEVWKTKLLCPKELFEQLAVE